MEIIGIGILVAILCWIQHVRESRRPISLQTFNARLRELQRKDH